jgi:hypothetical protein
MNWHDIDPILIGPSGGSTSITAEVDPMVL